MDLIAKSDPQVAKLIQQEKDRQENNLQMIASENYASKAVLAAQGSVMTNKYAEGYPNKRFYQGCGYYDCVEQLAIDRAKKLFKMDHANVQPHAGAQANIAVYYALLKPGDMILGMDLAAGGHLTHGQPFTFSGKYYKSALYGVNKDTYLIDYEVLRKLAEMHRPQIIVAGASAYPRFLDFKAFSEIAKSVGALLMVDMAHIAGLIAAGVHPDPSPYADIITTTTHKTLRGPRGGMILCKAEYAKKIDSGVFPGLQGGPLMHAIAAKAVAFQEALKPSFKKYQQQVVANAKALAAALQARGFELLTGGTDNHLMLVDLRSKAITGAEAAVALEQAGIVVNKNRIPFDPQTASVTSGIRIGTPALTTRGMKAKEMQMIAGWIDEILSNKDNTQFMAKIRREVNKLCRKFPVYR